MESLLAIGVGLGLRILLDALTDNDDRVSGVLVGMWEGVVLNHFIRRIPRSFDPYLGFGFRIFVDFLFTQSLSRLALVVLWSLVGMLLADVAPNLWRDSGLRRLYRQVRKDIRRVERAVPRIRIKNDLPSMRLFNRSRTAASSSSQASSSIRSDRAAPSRSPVPSPAPATSPARRPGRTPPGTFPNVSGWSETGTDVSSLRLRVEDVVTHPGPSPSLIPSQELATYGRTDATRLSTSRTRSTTVQKTTIMQTQTQKNESVVRETVVEAATIVAAAAASMSVEPIEDVSRHNPPTIPDDWVDIDRPPDPGTQANEPVAAFQPDPKSTSEPYPPTPSRPISMVIPPPAVDSIPDIPDVDHGNQKSRPPDQISLPESRAASVIGGVYDQPQSRTRDTSRSRLDRATTEIGVDPKSLAPFAMQSTRSQATSRASSQVGSRLKQSVEVNAPKEPAGEPVSQIKPQQTGPVHSMEPIIVSAPAVTSISDVDHGNKASQPPDQIRLPESRAASVIGGAYDQPQSRTRDTSRSRLDKATSEIGVDPQSLAPFSMQSTISQTTSRAASRVGPKLKQSVEVDAPKESAEELVSQNKPQQTGPVHSIIDPPPAVSGISDVDHGNQKSRPPDQISLPESRAASVIGGVYDQPQSRTRDTSRSRLDRATTEIGVDPQSLAPFAMQSTKSQTTSRAASRVGSKLKQSVEVNAPKESAEEPVSQGKPQQTDPVHSVVVPPPAVSSISDVDHDNKASQPPDQIRLPESRAASVIGGAYDQPQSRTRDTSRSRLDRATTEIGVDPQSLAPFAMQSTISQTTSRAASRVGSRLKQSVEVDAPTESAEEPVGQGEPQQTDPVHGIVVPPPAVSSISDVDHDNKASRPPDQMPLPESRAASVIGGVYDQPQSRTRDTSRSRLDRATTEIGVDPQSLAPFAMQSTKSQTTSRAASRVGSRLRQLAEVDAPKESAEEPVSQSKPQQTGPVHGMDPIIDPPPAVNSIPDVDDGNKASQPPDQMPLPESRAASVIGGVYDQPQCRSAYRDPFRSRPDRTTSEIGADPRSLAPFTLQSTKSQTTSRAASRSGSRLRQSIDVNPPTVPPKDPTGEPVSQGRSTEPPMITTPAQVDPPASILSQVGDADTPPLLFATSPREPGKTQIMAVDPTLGDDAGHPVPGGGANKKDDAGRDRDSLFDLPPPTFTPPPPFSEFDGIPEGFVAGEAPTKDEPVMQDEGPTELTEEQKVIEEKRLAFLSKQAQDLEGSLKKLQKQLQGEDDPDGNLAKALESDLEDSEKTLSVVTERLKKKKFSGPPSDPAIKEIILTGKSVSEVQSVLNSTVLDMLLARDDAGPMTVQFCISKSKPLKANAKSAKEAVLTFAKRHKFVTRFEPATPGIINVTF